MHDNVNYWGGDECGGGNGVSAVFCLGYLVFIEEYKKTFEVCSAWPKCVFVVIKCNKK